MRIDQMLFTSIWLSNFKSRTPRQSAAACSPHSLLTGFTNIASDGSSSIHTATWYHLTGIKDLCTLNIFFPSIFPILSILIATSECQEHSNCWTPRSSFSKLPKIQFTCYHYPETVQNYYVSTKKIAMQ